MQNNDYDNQTRGNTGLLEKPLDQPPPPPSNFFVAPPAYKLPVRTSTIAPFMIALVIGLLMLIGLIAATILVLINLNVTTETETFDLGQPRAVEAKIDLGAGNLKISGGLAIPAQAIFHYNRPELKPLAYQVPGQNAQLVISQPSGSTSGFYRNDWEVRFQDGLPLNLQASVGAGDADLRLSGLDLTGLTVSNGAGNTQVDLSGPRTHNLNGVITSGAGNIILRLPAGAGVRVVINGLVSHINASNFQSQGNVYTNAAYGTAAVTLNLTVTSGAADITLEQK